MKPCLNLGIVSDEIARDFAAAVRAGVSLGLRRYEIRNLAAGRAPMCGEAAMLEVERIARQEGVEITALSPGLFKNTDDAAAFRREMDQVYPRAVEWVHRWKLPGRKLPGLIVFGFHKPGATEATAPEFSSANPPGEVVDWLAEAGERARADGVTLMIEPEPICWCDSGRATARLIARAGSVGLKINYDPGNVAWLENRDPLDEFAVVAPFIANVHIKDLRPLTRGAGFPEWVPAGEGMIDYAAHFRALREIGYDGPVSLEPHMDSSAEATQRCKEAVERVA
jgi:L-ribulose-5-phosphate 3-epimerase